MSRPVKVEDSFYQQLQKAADELDIPLQEALKRELDRRSMQIRQLESQQSELQKRLRQAAQQIQTETDSSEKAKQDVKAVRSKLDGIQRQLDERTLERDEVLSLCADWKCRSDEFESELEHTQEAAGKVKTQHQTVRFVLGLVAILAVGYMLWTQWRRIGSAEQEVPKDAQPAFQPWTYGV